jgi:hypothetical protein
MVHFTTYRYHHNIKLLIPLEYQPTGPLELQHCANNISGIWYGTLLHGTMIPRYRSTRPLEASTSHQWSLSIWYWNLAFGTKILDHCALGNSTHQGFSILPVSDMSISDHGVLGHQIPGHFNIALSSCFLWFGMEYFPSLCSNHQVIMVSGHRAPRTLTMCTLLIFWYLVLEPCRGTLLWRTKSPYAMCITSSLGYRVVIVDEVASTWTTILTWLLVMW